MPRLSYVMKFVSDMDAAVAFYRDVVGLELKFASPEWSEFSTGDTTLALHPASEANPAGGVELGFSVDDLDAFHRETTAKGVAYVRPPEAMHGMRLATFLDCEGAKVTVSG
jgi:predicted enzyme related to lactoylglutathione lyase